MLIFSNLLMVCQCLLHHTNFRLLNALCVGKRKPSITAGKKMFARDKHDAAAQVLRSEYKNCQEPSNLEIGREIESWWNDLTDQEREEYCNRAAEPLSASSSPAFTPSVSSFPQPKATVDSRENAYFR